MLFDLYSQISVVTRLVWWVSDAEFVRSVYIIAFGWTTSNIKHHRALGRKITWLFLFCWSDRIGITLEKYPSSIPFGPIGTCGRFWFFSTQETFHATPIACPGTFVEIGIPGRLFASFIGSEYLEHRSFYLPI
jgi:hypothetical protein